MRILGLAGRKGHGKDTFAKLLLQHDKRFKRLAFADRLKTICVEVFGIRRPDFDHPQKKDCLLDAPIKLDKQIDRLREVSKVPEIKPRGWVANTPRQLLQYIGTDYIRSVRPTYWIDAVRDEVESADADTRFAITDVRFPNEAQRIHELGGKVLRLVRLGRQDDPHPEHSSENLDFPSDYTLGIVENNWTLPQLIAIGSAMGQLDTRLKGFDWTRLIKKAKAGDYTIIKGDINSHTAILYYGEYLIPAIIPEKIVERV